jgi:hypothetical protein
MNRANINTFPCKTLGVGPSRQCADAISELRDDPHESTSGQSLVLVRAADPVTRRCHEYRQMLPNQHVSRSTRCNGRPGTDPAIWTGGGCHCVHSQSESRVSGSRAPIGSQRFDRPGRATAERIPAHHLQPDSRRTAANDSDAWRLSTRSCGIAPRPGVPAAGISNFGIRGLVRRTPR